MEKSSNSVAAIFAGFGCTWKNLVLLVITATVILFITRIHQSKQLLQIENPLRLHGHGSGKQTLQLSEHTDLARMHNIDVNSENSNLTVISSFKKDPMLQLNKSQIFNGLEQAEHHHQEKESTGNNRSALPKKCRRHTNVVFLKTHKTGSETTSQIFMRFADINNLSIVLPKSRWPIMGWPGAFGKNHYIHPPEETKFNILCLHCIYNRHAIDKLMEHGAKYVTILRDPWHQFTSAFNFFKWEKIIEKEIGKTTTNHLEKFLENPGRFYKWEKDNAHAYLRNYMSFDLGLPPAQYDDMNAIIEYVNIIDNDFDLVMILEYYDESLILLRRLLCWKLEDILYIPNNIKRKITPAQPHAEQLYHHFSQADYYLYQHFTAIFKQRLNDSSGLLKEVAYFQKINTEFTRYCKRVSKNSSLILQIDRSNWNDFFSLDESYCTKSRLYIPDYMSILKKQRYGIATEKPTQKLWPID
ncbi:galactose-3-O-sulfotransferase 2-like [Saccoglossus kowalevskii]